MKITIVGSGYVGLVSGACLADAGNDVLCLDLDTRRITQLKSGSIPIHEPTLDTLIQRCGSRGTLRFTSDAAEAAVHGDIQMIAVGTPSAEDGSADLAHVLAAAENIALGMTRRTIVVTKSTVPVGTGDKVRAHIQAILDKRGELHDFAVVSNPEFLREGDAIRDFKEPDRVVIGACEQWAISVMRKLYAPFVTENRPILVMDLRSAELAKYAANAMLATRISFMNELANLAERVGADIEPVRMAIGADPRIGPQFLRPGCGYGGSCFPKDVAALIHTAQQDAKMEMEILNAVEATNQRQKSVLVEKIQHRLGKNLAGKHIAIWGMAFKPDTDDMREAPAMTIITGLLNAGATISAFDPVAMNEARKRFVHAGPRLQYARSAIEALANADALVLITEWAEFKLVPISAIAEHLRTRLIFDGRNIWNQFEMETEGFEYQSIGRAKLSMAYDLIVIPT
jgi:UDPglucose 6-dehydrogenase